MQQVTMNGNTYRVRSTPTGFTVHVLKKRKALGFGYSYADGADTFESTIKPGSPNWNRAVRIARGE